MRARVWNQISFSSRNSSRNLTSNPQPQVVDRAQSKDRIRETALSTREGSARPFPRGAAWRLLGLGIQISGSDQVTDGPLPCRSTVRKAAAGVRALSRIPLALDPPKDLESKGQQWNRDLSF